jgi:hypothetical protein
MPTAASACTDGLDIRWRDDRRPMDPKEVDRVIAELSKGILVSYSIIDE